MGISKLCCGCSEQSSESRTPAFQRFACGVGHVINDVIIQLLFSFRLVFFMKVLDISASNAGWLIFYGLASHGAISPLSAFLVDKINIPFLSRKLGKRKSWHLIGTVLGAIVVPMYFSSCFACQSDGQQWQKMVYVTALNTFLALAVSLIEIGHLSLILVIAKDQREAVELNAWRTGFTFLSGILTYLVAWGILGQDSKDNLSPESSMDFTVMTLILIGISLVFAVIFYTGSKEPTGKLVNRRAEDFVRKCSFIPSNDPLKSMIYTGYVTPLTDEQRKERMRDHFMNSLKSKDRPYEIQNEDSRFRERSFPRRFIDALFTIDECQENESREESPNAHKARGEPVSKGIKAGVSMPRETAARMHEDEEMFKSVKRLPEERKKSLVLSILDTLIGLDGFDSEGHYKWSAVAEVSDYSDGVVVNFPQESKVVDRLTRGKESNIMSNGQWLSKQQQSSEHEAVINNQDHVETPGTDFEACISSLAGSFGVDNHGVDCDETESKPSSLDQMSDANVDELFVSEVMPQSSQIDGGTSMNRKGDTESAHPATPESKTVRKWLKDVNLYKVGIIYTCAKVSLVVSYSYLPLLLTDRLKFGKEAIANLPLVVLISATISSGITKLIIGKIGTKWSFVSADLVVVGAAFWCYFITQSTRLLIYPAAVLLGFGLSAMFVNALSFAAEVVGDNKSTSGFVFAFIGLMANLIGGALISAIQKLFPSGHGSGDCEVCGDYVRHVFSIVPGSLAAIGILIVLVSYTSQATCKRNAYQIDDRVETKRSMEDK